MGLLQADPVLTAPSYDVEGLLDAVKADETFRAGVPESSWTATARDKIVQGVQDIVVQAVTPLRLSLLSLGLGKALSMADVPTLRGYLPYLPWALLAACVLLAGLLLLCTHKRMIKGVLYIGSACGAAGICLGVIMGAVAYLGLPGRLAAALCAAVHAAAPAASKPGAAHGPYGIGAAGAGADAHWYTSTPDEPAPAFRHGREQLWSVRPQPIPSPPRG